MVIEEQDPRANPSQGDASERPAANTEEALARARTHARRALAESLATVRALLDAAALSLSEKPATSHPTLRLVERALLDLERLLTGDVVTDGSKLLEAVLDALDGEIARWEKRSRDDADARIVLRSFLGMREILWELGVRSPTPSGSTAASPTRPRKAANRGTPTATRRVQRVRVEG